MFMCETRCSHSAFLYPGVPENEIVWGEPLVHKDDVLCGGGCRNTPRPLCPPSPPLGVHVIATYFFFLFFLFMCESLLLLTCNLFSFNANVNWLPGSTSPYGYSKQPVLLLHLIFPFVIIFSYKCKSTLKVVVVEWLTCWPNGSLCSQMYDLIIPCVELSLHLKLFNMKNNTFCLQVHFHVNQTQFHKKDFA